MQPQGTSIVNIGYFESAIQQTTNLVAQLNYFKNGGFEAAVIAEVQLQLHNQLQEITNLIVPDVLTQLNAANSQLAKLTPAVPLVTVPVTDLASCIAFITGFQSSVLSLQVLAPYTNLISQVAALATEIASLTSAINSASSAITPAGPSVQIPGSPSVQSPEKIGVQMTVTRI